MNNKRLYIIIVGLILSFVLFPQEVKFVKTEKTCLSFINITGNTNVNNFEFNLDGSNIDDEIVNIVKRNKSEYYEISVPVKNFQTSNKLLYNDFLELVKADKYPNIIIAIPFTQLNSFLTGNKDFIPEIKITLAGVTKTYSIPGLVSACPAGSILINGIKVINLTDFNLDPPEKFQGLIKVKDQVKISFGFVILRQNNA